MQSQHYEQPAAVKFASGNDLLETFTAFRRRGGKLRTWAAAGLPVPIIAGGGPTAQNPLLAPIVTGTDVTVDIMLDTPTRITRMISDISLQRFIADLFFASAGGVTGGAAVYDRETTNELYTDNDIEQIAPGSTIPLVTSSRLVPNVALVKKWGARTFITDEARDRNNAVLFTNEVRKMTNTIVRKINQAAVATITADVATTGQTIHGHNWNTVVLSGSTPTVPTSTPAADFAAAQLAADALELGVVYDTFIANPAQVAQLALLYGDAFQRLLDAYGLTIYSSNRVPAGTGYFAAEKQVGEMRLEKPLTTVTYRREEQERTFVQATVRPLFAVTNPYRVLVVDTLAG